MKLYLKDSKYYYLTVQSSNDNNRKKHLLKELDGYDLHEVNPVHFNNFSTKLADYQKKNKSGATGFLKILDLASQNMNKVFKPFVILEDDIAKYRKFPEYIDIPNNCDILYTGLSSCGWTVVDNSINNYSSPVYYQNAESFDNLIKIYNMLSTHSMVICSIRGMLCLQKCLMEDFYKNRGWDISITEMQPYLNVFALKEPLFYQSKYLNGSEKETKINYENERFTSKKIPYRFINKTNISVITNYTK